MNIDERLEKLAERHEALAQTVEIIAGMQRSNEEHLAQLTQAVQELKTTVQQDGEHIRALVRIAEIHVHRLTHLEGDTP